MKQDFDMLTYHFEDEIKIVAISDLHLGNPNFDIKRWNEFKKYLLENENIYLVILGDLIENQTKNSHSPFNISVIDGIAMTPFEQKKRIAEELKPFKDRILAGCPGNHESRKDNKATDQDIMYDVFCKLDIEDKYRPNMAILKIQIGNRNECYRQTYTIGIMHGSGGGTLTGSSVNKNERFDFIFDGLDCLITGHVHKSSITKPMKVVIDSKNNKIGFKPFYTVVATSWLNYGGYALAQQLVPASHMEQEIVLRKTKTKTLEIKVK